MTTIDWIGTTGNWNDPTQWSTGTVPGANDDVLLNTDDFQITVSAPIHVNSISESDFAFGTISFESGVSVVKHGFQNETYNSLILGNTTGSGTTTLKIDGTLLDYGYLQIGDRYGSPTGSTLLEVGHLKTDTSTESFDLNGGAAGSGISATFIDKGDSACKVLSQGQFYLTGNALLEVAKGSIETLNGTISLDGVHAFIADKDSIHSNSALANLKENDGSLMLSDGAIVDTQSRSFLNDGQLEIDNGAVFGTVAGVNFNNKGSLSVASQTQNTTLTIDGTLHNSGTIELNNFYAGAAAVVTVGHLENTGTITVNGAQPNQVAGTTEFIDTGDAAPTTLKSGVNFSVEGNALIEFASGQITTIAKDASLTIGGSEAFIADKGQIQSNSALSDFAHNAGTFSISGGAELTNQNIAFVNSGTYDIGAGSTVTTASGVSFTNTGTLNLESNGYDEPSAYLDVGGTLTNSGKITITNNEGSVTGVVANHVNDLGSLDLEGQSGLAEMVVQSDAAPATIGAGVSITLGGDALLQFATGSITSIAAGGTLELDGYQARIADAALPTINSALSGLASNAGTLTLRDGANPGNENTAFDNSGTYSIERGTAVTTADGVNFTNSGTVTLDGDGFGGSSLVVGGLLTNSGTITIGSGVVSPYEQSLTESSEVFAAQLDNTGTINLFSSIGSSAQALFNDTGDVAPTSIASGVSLNLVGNALFEFGSGEITSIDAGGQITIRGPQAFIADADSIDSNSALSGLNDNEGIFTLAQGASLGPIGGSLTNGGTFSLLGDEQFSISQDFENTGSLVIDRGDSSTWYQEGGSVVKIAGTLNNSGTVAIGDNAIEPAAATTVTVGHLVNTGTLDIASIGNGNFASGAPFQVTLNDTGDAAPDTLSGQTIDISGNALLEYASGGITKIASDATLNLDGEQARIAIASDTTTSSALTGLVENDGTLTLNDGAIVANGTNDFTNRGTLNLEANDSSGESIQSESTFTVGGHLENDGTIALSVTDIFGSPELAAASLTNFSTLDVGYGDLTTTGNIINQGSLTIGDNNTLSGEVHAGGLYEQISGETLLNDTELSATKGVEIKGGVMDGTGFVESDVTVSGGVLSPTGEIEIDANLVIKSGGTLAIALDAADGSTDLIIDNSNVSLGGTLDLSVSNASHLHTGQEYTIIDGTDKVHGSFDKLEYNGTTVSGSTIDIGHGMALEVVLTNHSSFVEVEVVAAHDHRVSPEQDLWMHHATHDALLLV